MPVTYVIGDVAGAVESPVYCLLKMNEASPHARYQTFGGSRAPLKNLQSPPQPSPRMSRPSSGTRNGTSRSRCFATRLGHFRVLVLIFIPDVRWFRSFLTPLVVMAAIPFSLVGILPAHGLLGARSLPPPR